MDALNAFACAIYDTFWSPKFWLPSDLTWEDLKNKSRYNTEDAIYPDSADLYAVIPLTAIFLLARILITKFVLTPIGGYFGLKNRKFRPVEPNDTLNNFYETNSKPGDSDLDNLSNQVGWPRRKVERWFRLKRSSMKHSEMEKFTETGFLTMMYSSVLIYGTYLIHDEDFFHDYHHSYKKSVTTWPLDTIKPEFRAYYIIAMSWATSLLATIVLLDVRRRDFYVQLVHHLATVFLFYLSWIVNSVIPGLLTLFINDLIHPFLNSSKMFMCLKMKKAATCSFCIFMVVWMYTRVYLHFDLVWTHVNAVYEYQTNRGICWIMTFGTSLMVLLQLIHFLYTRIILQVAWNRIYRGKYGDVRSDTEEETDEEDEKHDEINANGRLKRE